MRERERGKLRGKTKYVCVRVRYREFKISGRKNETERKKLRDRKRIGREKENEIKRDKKK